MRDIEPLCDRIYDATIDADTWPGVLQDIASASGCAWGALLTRRSDAWIGWRISPADAPAVDSYLRSDGPQRSITTERLFSIGHPGFISDHEHFTEEERRADGYFQWADAHGFRHGAATGFQLNTGDLAVVQFMRRSGRPPLRGCELEHLDRFRPHLARAAMLAARWKMERVRAATEALALVGLPAVVLSADCRVMASNSLAQDLTRHLIWLARDGLALSDPTASAKLKRQVAACALSGLLESASSFPAWDDERKAPLIVHVVPLKGDRRELFEGGLALVLFTDATAPNQPNPELIREIFDLTAAEARVAAQLAQGRSVEQIASAHSVSLSTVRSQAKSILHKLGAHRQAEVAARLVGARSIRPPSLRKS
jgi:DNA-binding CsgD family transcriptional regulator